MLSDHFDDKEIKFIGDTLRAFICSKNKDLDFTLLIYNPSSGSSEILEFTTASDYNSKLACKKTSEVENLGGITTELKEF